MWANRNIWSNSCTRQLIPYMPVTLIVNDKGNPDSVWFPANILDHLPGPLVLIGNAIQDVWKQSLHCSVSDPLSSSSPAWRVCYGVSVPQQERINPGSNHRKFIKSGSWSCIFQALFPCHMISINQITVGSLTGRQAPGART